MKNTKIACFFLLLLALATACRKQEMATVSTDIEIQQPVITDAANGAKQLDFTVVVTQIGNAFDRDFDFTLTRLNSQTVLDSFQTMLPTAREFVKFSITVPGPGDYMAWVFVGSGGSGSGTGMLVKVP